MNIDTGDIIFDFNTKGTSKYFDANNSYYFCSADNRSTQIFRIDYNGKILENIEVDGVYHEGVLYVRSLREFIVCYDVKEETKRKYRIILTDFSLYSNIKA